MKRTALALALLFVVFLGVPADSSGARVVVRTRHPRPPRVKVTVHHGFPIHRTLPPVVVRPAAVVRVAPRVYLPPVVFTPAVVTVAPAGDAQVWRDGEELEREDGWTDFSLDVDHRGDRLLLEIDKGIASVSFAEVVFDNGDTQVVDFNEKPYAKGIYGLLDFKDGRKVDHVRVVAKAESEETEISLRLVV